MSIATLLTSAPVATWTDLSVHSLTSGSQVVNTAICARQPLLSYGGPTLSISAELMGRSSAFLFSSGAGGPVTASVPTVAALASYLDGIGIGHQNDTTGVITFTNPNSSYATTLDASATGWSSAFSTGGSTYAIAANTSKSFRWLLADATVGYIFDV